MPTSSAGDSGPSNEAGQATGDPSHARLIAVISLPVVLIIAVIIGGVIWSNQQPAASTAPVALPAAPAPGGAGKACTRVMSALPPELNGQARRDIVGTPPGVAAWGDPPVVLRCGLPTPAELTCLSALTQVSNVNGQPGVQWLQISEGGQTTYLAADRPVRIALTLPDDAGTAAIQELSSVISGVLPARDVCSNGKLVPSDNG